MRLVTNTEHTTIAAVYALCHVVHEYGAIGQY